MPLPPQSSSRSGLPRHSVIIPVRQPADIVQEFFLKFPKESDAMVRLMTFYLNPQTKVPRDPE